jgi:ureidoglycolate amidohydrolase
LPRGHYKAFLELHIEQGPILERERIPLGIVTTIAAPACLNVLIEGSGGHAGGVLMPDRRDALCAAAELILAVESAAKNSAAPDSVATVGTCEVFPGAINSIPSRVRLSVDARDIDLTRRDAMLASIESACRQIGEKRQVSTRIEFLNADAPASCSPELIEALAQSCESRNVKFLRMVSRAYHDSLFMSRVAPAVMLFIPCQNGYSHRPDEYASPDDIACGALILAETLAKLSS